MLSGAAAASGQCQGPKSNAIVFNSNAVVSQSNAVVLPEKGLLDSLQENADNKELDPLNAQEPGGLRC